MATREDGGQKSTSRKTEEVEKSRVSTPPTSRNVTPSFLTMSTTFSTKSTVFWKQMQKSSYVGIYKRGENRP